MLAWHEYPSRATAGWGQSETGAKFRKEDEKGENGDIKLRKVMHPPDTSAAADDSFSENRKGACLALVLLLPSCA